MDILQGIITHLANSERRQLLQYGVYLQAGLLVPLTLCGFGLSGTANVGFNTIFVLLLNISFCAGANHLVKDGGSPIAIGFLIGVSSMMTCVNFMNSIFWGQLSGCSPLEEGVEIPGYSCSSPGSYMFESVLTVFLFVSQVAFTFASVNWRDELIIDSPDSQRGYDGIGQSSGHGSHNPMATSSSVDL